MGILMPVGAVLIVVGMAGSAASCYGNSIFDRGSETQTAAELRGATEVPADQTGDSRVRLVMAPISGLALAIGLVCLGIGVGNWRRPVPSDVRPANPWSDQPGTHGDPPVGQV